MPENGSGRLDRIEAILERLAAANEDRQAMWNAIVETHSSVESLRDSMIQTRISVEDTRRSVEALRDSMTVLRISAESLVEATRNSVEESKALRKKLDEHEQRMEQAQELRERRMDARIENLLSAIRDLIDRIPPENLKQTGR